MKIIKIDNIGIEFDNGTQLEDIHSQDCCEHVYADWESLKDTDIMSHDFKDHLEIEGVKESGFRLEGYFIPCYNDQNGYYGSDLELQITLPNKEKRIIDVSEFVSDNID